ncbi:MAG: sensor histidine kinase [Sphingobium sp.]
MIRRPTMFRKLLSTHSRILLLAMVIELALVSAMLFTVFHLVRSQIDHADADQVTELTQDFTLVSRQQGENALIQLVNSRSARTRDELFLLVGSKGETIAGNIDRWPAGLKPGKHLREIWIRSRAGSALAFGVVATALPDGKELLVGHLIESSQATKAIVRSATLYALLFAIPLALVGAWGTVRLIDQRIGKIVGVARTVSAGNLAGRVPVDGSGDRFDQLAQTINAMLDRLGHLVGELRLVTDSLAHDLRSPLTRLRAHIDRAARARGEESLRGEMQAIGEEADSLLAMLSTSLEISRAEAGIGREHLEQCDLSALLRDVADLYAPLAEEVQRTIRVDAQMPIFARIHRELLSRALANLIDNALKYGEGTISLRSRADFGCIAISVEDEGQGIAEKDQEKALRRFGRLDPARANGGAGLGLSLVSAAASLHGGTVELVTTNGTGFEVRMVFDLETEMQ